MVELVKYIVTELVANKDAVEVTEVEESEKVSIVKVIVDKEDVGRVIGRDGKVAGSIRTIVKSASMGLGKRFIVKIGERE